MVRTRLAISVVLVSTLLLLNVESKSVDPYKVLGVSRDAKQREIQKAFHKLSLKYHPDKNKNKGAQEKFAEINNAYEILSDEEKRKNYDLYGDEKGQPGFDSGFPGGNGGYSYSSNGGHGGGGFNFGGPGGWQNMGGGGGSKSFSFSFGGPSESSFGFGMDDIFSMFSGGSSKGKEQFGGFGSSSKAESKSKSSTVVPIRTINSQVYKKEILDQGMTWLVLSYLPSQRGTQYHESIIEEVAESLQGALKVGRINCETESSLCKQLGIVPRRAPRLFVYSYTSSGKATLAEYTEELVAKKVKSFCQEHLPRFSKRIDLNTFDVSAVSSQRTPKVMLLSTKKDTPVIWRVLSGLYNGRFVFYNTEVHDTSDPKIQKLGVDAFPAIVGWLSNGEKQVLKTGITVKNLKSAVQELGKLLEGFEKKNKKVSSNSQPGQSPSESLETIPLLLRSNFDSICGENTPVCIIGAFRSSHGKEKLQSVMSKVSQKSLSRRQASTTGSQDTVSYSLLDATKQSAFLSSLDKSEFKTSDKFLIAYKPRRGKFATFKGDMTMEEVEKFVAAVLNGDIQFTKTRQKPQIK
ncbi:DNAJ heat shock N-terminal domain-containing protein [Arabidopsis lyrata subsp. lyrata]|uniref:DNAJ heat shock N-terminal domain-containing protein n=1 Tax=Arabidopsis lyrata subsp. lyrata TaxID=81972 RepID=D7L7P9_ARALL|nr:dnaJ protein ERDJ3A [Arabidopsis lyrata subsp. lyrata]EFH58853.1 DNAJ heat shock N-terminal domain-containing protein [Arabidopsis lyrata subsp. lyrata]|eukprot:XP_002882594.1 dnaJ protein ERDJ3A [Arabidopsis lyrata subsp. lyrata]